MIRLRLTRHDLLLLLLAGIIAVTLALSGLGLLSPDTTWTTSTERRGEGEVDVLLGIETDDERWNVDDLLADAEHGVSMCAQRVAGSSVLTGCGAGGSGHGRGGWTWRVRACRHKSAGDAPRNPQS